MKKILNQNVLKKKHIELLSPFNSYIFPDVYYISKLTNPQKDLIKNMCIKKVITTRLKRTKNERQMEITNRHIETARHNTTAIRAQFKEKSSDRKKSDFKEKLFESSSLTKRNEHFLFDPYLRKMINEFYFDEKSDCFKIEEIERGMRELFLEQEEEILGSLCKIDFYKFHYDVYHSEMTHLLGLRPVRLEREESLETFDIKDWILDKINLEISECQNKIKNLNIKNFEKDTIMAKNKQVLEENVLRLSGLIDETDKRYLFNNLENLFEEIKKKNFKFVSYSNCETLQETLGNMPIEEFEQCKEIAMQINILLRSLLLKTNFVNSTKFMDINNLANEKYFLAWYNNLIGILHSRKIFSFEDISYLAKQTDLLEKLEFIRISFKQFQTEYLDQWKSYEEKDKDAEVSEKKNEMKEIYDQFKKMEEMGFSATKRELIGKVESFIKSRKLNEKIETVLKEELEKYKELNEMESEYQNTKNYLELIIKLPFDLVSKDQKNIERARSILDTSHFGMEEVKKRILEFLAIGKLKDDFISNKVLCLLGPPGVGKTSIAKDIAKCLNRKFVRISLGGENDPSILKGHRRTYLGAYPGKLLNALKTAQTENPVILLDEIDKLGKSHKGNVADVLLEILDPMQNKEFNDHYLEAPLDLSKVLFICSANILDGSTISPALYDRLEVIELSGYTKKEKLIIFNKYLLAKIREKVGLDLYNVEIVFDDEVVLGIIDDYARESGVRSLEKKTQSLLEKLALDFVTDSENFGDYKIKKKEDVEQDGDVIEIAKQENETKFKEPKEPKEKYKQLVVTQEMVRKYLGPKLFHSSTIHHENENLIGFAYGLGYNTIGGSVLSIEVIDLPEPLKKDEDSEPGAIKIKKEENGFEGSLQMTGSLGEVMKESVEIAYTFAKNFIHKLDSKNHFLDKTNLHIHFPSGASKKDGPSAGVTIVSALLSIALNKSYNRDFAMTGEISLNGNVMKIGGVREKILAARREGIKNVFLPLSNKNDVDELKDYIKEDMNFVFVKNYAEIFKVLFEKA